MVDWASIFSSSDGSKTSRRPQKQPFSGLKFLSENFDGAQSDSVMTILYFFESREREPFN